MVIIQQGFAAIEFAVAVWVVAYAYRVVIGKYPKGGNY